MFNFTQQQIFSLLQAVATEFGVSHDYVASDMDCDIDDPNVLSAYIAGALDYSDEDLFSVCDKIEAMTEFQALEEIWLESF